MNLSEEDQEILAKAQEESDRKSELEAGQPDRVDAILSTKSGE